MSHPFQRDMNNLYWNQYDKDQPTDYPMPPNPLADLPPPPMPQQDEVMTDTPSAPFAPSGPPTLKPKVAASLAHIEQAWGMDWKSVIMVPELHPKKWHVCAAHPAPEMGCNACRIIPEEDVSQWSSTLVESLSWLARESKESAIVARELLLVVVREKLANEGKEAGCRESQLATRDVVEARRRVKGRRMDVVVGR